MKPYLVTATDQGGRRDTFAREAASLDHLRTVLEREGYRDIEFIDDELSARLRQQRPETMRNPAPDQLKLEARLRHGPAPLAVWLNAAKGSTIFLGIVAAAGAYGVWNRQYGWTAVAFVVIAGWAWLVRTALRRGEAYNDLLRAQARGDVEATRALIERLRADPTLQGNEQLQVDLRFRAAALRAREGDLAGALADVESLRNSPHGAQGMFDSRVASLHYQAGDIDGYLQHMGRAFDASGQAQLQRLDLAFAHARLGDAQRAQELLDGLERRNLSALHNPLATATDGLLAVRRGDTTTGLAQLAEAVAGFAKFAANPAVWPFQGILVGHFALALAQAGHRAEANAALAEWRDVVDTCLDPQARALLRQELGE
jgi:hypothetical protein